MLCIKYSLFSAILSEIQQKYAHQILEDIKNGVLEVVEGKTFLQYIQEYQEKAVRLSVCRFAETFGVDEEDMYTLYTITGKREVDKLALDKLEGTADPQKLTAYYKVSLFKSRIKFHQDLKTFIENRMADLSEEEMN